MKEKLCNIRGLRLAAMICLLLTAILVFMPCFQTGSLHAEVGLPLIGNKPFSPALLLAGLSLVQLVLLFRNRKGSDIGAAAAGTATLALMLLVWFVSSLMDDITGSIVYIMPGPAGFRVDISVLGLLALAASLSSAVMEWCLVVKRRS